MLPSQNVTRLDRTHPPSAGVSCPIRRTKRLASRLAGRSISKGGYPYWQAAALAIVAGKVASLLLLTPTPVLTAWQATIVDALILLLCASPVLWYGHRRLAKALDIADRSPSDSLIGSILAATADGVIVTDEEGVIRSSNAGTTRIFGYTELELIGRSINILVPPQLADAHNRHLNDFRNGAAAARLMGARGSLCGYSKGGQEIPVEISIAQAGTPSGNVFVAIVRDVTERRRIECELRAAIARAEAATQAKSEFLANMSHEIRTPLNAVIGIADLMQDTPLNEEQRDFVETIRNSGDALLGVINDILDFSKIEAGHMELERVVFDPRHCTETVADLLAPRAAQKNIDLIYEIDEKVPPQIIGDVTRFRQVLVNLAGNAIKFTESGEVYIQVRPTSASADQIILQVDVRDTGQGLTQAQQEKLFKPFSQGDSSITRRYGGTGLGLAISRSLVELMGGHIWIRSEQGAGSTFSFSAPFAVAEPTATMIEVSPESLDGKRLLIVDDNATNRRILTHQTERWGAKVHAFGSPQAALNFVAGGNCFDLGLFDLHMPGMDGIELARAIRYLLGTKPAPLLLLSSLGTTIPPQARDHFAAVLNKPLKTSALRSAIERSLGSLRQPVILQSDVDRNLATRMPLRVLVADDNAVNRTVTTAMLERFGYKPRTVADGEGAVECASKHEFDLVLMDVLMPRIDGLEATRRLRKHEAARSAGAHIVAMTASVGADHQRDCLAAGMDGFLPKPARLTDLRTVVEQAFHRSRHNNSKAPSTGTADP